jgi:hypothetical protein
MGLKFNISNNEVIFDSVNFIPSESCFFLTNNTSNYRVRFPYKLAYKSDYHYSDYITFLFDTETYAENYIFQIYERESDIRLGWLFPLQSLVSQEHEYAHNIHFLKYAFVTYFSLLKNENGLPFNTLEFHESKDFNILDIFGEKTFALTLSKQQITKINNFNIDNYFPSLINNGFYAKTLNTRPNKLSLGIHNLSNKSKICLDKISNNLENDIYLKNLFGNLLVFENHPLVKFLILYQVIELLIDKIFSYSIKKNINELFDENGDTLKIREQILDLAKEKHRFSKLLNEFSLGASRSDHLKDLCDDLLIKKNRKEESNLEFSIYGVRSLLVHSYRNLEINDLELLDELNREFQQLVASIVIHYKEEKIQVTSQ